LHNLGHVEIRRGNVEAAERIFDELGVGDDGPRHAQRRGAGLRARR
jgi:hypothetical protein